MLWNYDSTSVSPLPQHAYDATTHHRVVKGELIESFRGETWTFERISRPAYGNSTGRVSVERLCPDARKGARYDGRSQAVTECPHMWHRGGIETREFFPSVFGLYLGDASGEPA